MDERDKKITALQQQVGELVAWMQERKRQQISFPLDNPSKNVLGVVEYEGTGSTALTDSINLSGGAETINVPKAYADTIIVLIGSTRVEIPVVAFI